jgi:hypothetical protein
MSSAFLSSDAAAMAKTLAFDSRTIWFLLIEPDAHYIGFNLGRQQRGDAHPAAKPLPDVRGRDIAWRKADTSQVGASRQRHVEPVLRPAIQGFESLA